MYIHAYLAHIGVKTVSKLFRQVFGVILSSFTSNLRPLVNVDSPTIKNIVTINCSKIHKQAAMLRKFLTRSLMRQTCEYRPVKLDFSLQIYCWRFYMFRLNSGVGTYVYNNFMALYIFTFQKVKQH